MRSAGSSKASLPTLKLRARGAERWIPGASGRSQIRSFKRRLNERIWDRPDAPGIPLSAPLALSFKVGKLAFEEPALRIYTPTSTDWQSQNFTFGPAYGYTGRLSIP